jgi:hypothetical protein
MIKIQSVNTSGIILHVGMKVRFTCGWNHLSSGAIIEIAYDREFEGGYRFLIEDKEYNITINVNSSAIIGEIP